MRKISPFKSKPARGAGRRNRRAFALLFLALVLLFLWQPKAFTNVVYTIADPFWQARNKLADSLTTMQRYFASKTKLLQENQALSQELDQARQKLLTLAPLQHELDSLQPLLSHPPAPKTVTAAVLSRPPYSPYDTLVIDAGVQDGVAEGDIVTSVGGSVIGDVSNVFRDFSRVSLFSSPGTKTAVLIGGKGVQVNATGAGGGEFQILLPREVSVSAGDAVVLPGQTPQVLGVVQSVQYQETDFMQLVSFQSPVNIFELRYVTVDTSDASG